MQILLDNWPAVLRALVMTLEITVVGFAGCLVLGVLMAICRVSPITPLRVLGRVYVELFRNVPAMSLLILIVFGLPEIGVRLSLFVSAALTLGLVGAAFTCEAVRSGINAVPVGNAEAARAVGLTFTQTLRFVVLPQAFGSMVQPLVNVFIGQLLGSSLAALVNVDELTYQAQFLNQQYAGGIVLFCIAALFYVAIALLSGGVGARLERRFEVLR